MVFPVYGIELIRGGRWVVLEVYAWKTKTRQPAYDTEAEAIAEMERLEHEGRAHMEALHHQGHLAEAEARTKGGDAR